MKKVLNIFSALLLFNLCCISVCLAQSKDHNYVVKHVMQDAEGKDSVTTVEYYDGLGRKEQVVSDGIVPGSSGRSLLSRTLYDGVGREGKNFLPVSVSGLDYQSTLLYKYDDPQALSVISYDKLNRLTYADYHNHREAEDSWADPDFDESADYDANGNITNLSRMGFPDEKEGEHLDRCRCLDLQWQPVERRCRQGKRFYLHGHQELHPVW